MGSTAEKICSIFLLTKLQRAWYNRISARTDRMRAVKKQKKKNTWLFSVLTVVFFGAPMEPTPSALPSAVF
jgi:uncharacterized membrane protein YdjX (TVP38/TMEM64 family)